MGEHLGPKKITIQKEKITLSAENIQRSFLLGQGTVKCKASAHKFRHARGAYGPGADVRADRFNLPAANSRSGSFEGHCTSDNLFSLGVPSAFCGCSAN